MKLLLDSHVLLWWSTDHPQLGPEALDAIDDEGNEVYLSAASVWELAIKTALGRLETPADLVPHALSEGVSPLPIGLDHAAAAGALPLHHRDPFDRMLIAQADAEALTLVTADRVIRLYDVRWLDARR